MHFISFVLLLAQVAAPPPPPPPPPPAPCRTAEAAQFAFWVGEWELVGRLRLRPDADEWRETRAVNSIRPTLDGCVIEERFRALGENALQGTSVSVYDARAREWRQTWVDNQGGYIALTGGFQDGRMTLITAPRALPGGGTGMSRMVFHDIAADSLVWDWEGSRDGGRTWRLMWQIVYRRARGGPGGDAAVLLEADRAFNRATAERRVDGWVPYFAESGSMFRPGGLVTGHAAIRERMGQTFADTSFTLTWGPTQADASGDLGYTVGRYESRRRDADGTVLVGHGSYVTVWKRQTDGTWKIVLDIGNPDGPMRAAP